MSTEHSKPTPLTSVHERLGASFTDFGGWWMPLRYGSDVAEHRAVREAAGIFDLSHMGEVSVTGPDAAAFLDHALVGRLSAIEIGKAKYSLLCNEQGGVIDDLITYRLGQDDFLVVPNAANTPAALAALQARTTTPSGQVFDVTITDRTETTALIAVQGPAAEDLLVEVVTPESTQNVRDLRYYAIVDVVVHTPDGELPVKLARTGYTGEDGFEIYVDVESDPGAAERLWSVLEAAGESHGLVPCGLASRDSLRLEAGMPLHGHELSEQIDPYSAGLGPVVALKTKESFVGRGALAAIKDSGPAHKLVGLANDTKRAARPGYQVVHEGEVVGEVTSGAPSPTLGHAIALAFVRPDLAQVGTELAVDLRGKATPFTVVELPFYKRQR
ncbi:glycine cleavage system aminomethyltransferase GcvT [Kocuria sp.]|uniref:glycine cleavage system aminomethyltransferase GcvT n=1 Tax=Kocuria sp. TaxID=1871328 RepID=UPI0026E03B82|nr:glycine cleavage system aminomethyltransferase GcvT [Kocuria sp.]MDO5618872.1 glycine cleavage system aminomethyltransferase GcvT [Kocuria sp.]